MLQRRHVNASLPAVRATAILDWDDETIGKIITRVVGVLRQTGLCLADDAEGHYLGQMEKRGLKVDRTTRAVYFFEEQIRETMDMMRRTGLADSSVTSTISDFGGERPCGTYLVGNGASLVFDCDEWQARPARTEEFVGILQWAQGCDSVGELFAPCAVGDVNQRLAPILSYALMGRFCRKPFYHEQPTEVVHVKYLDEMARLVEAARGFYQPMQEWEFMNPPMKLARRSIETMLARIDSGLCSAVGIGTMAVRGMTAPVTVAGAAVAGLAEILAGLTFFHVLRPKIGLRGVAATGVMDLRSGQVSYGGVSVHLQNMAIWELLSRGIGVEGGFCTWYRDANEPGMQALYEFGLNQAFFSGVYRRSNVEIGGLACGGSFSPEQAVLDLAAVQEYDELAGGFAVDESIIGVEEILQAGFDATMHMSSDHTVAHMQDGVSRSDMFLRGLPANASHEKRLGQSETLLNHASQAVQSAREKGQAMEPDEQLGDVLDACVKAAAKELGIDDVPRYDKAR